MFFVTQQDQQDTGILPMTQDVDSCIEEEISQLRERLLPPIRKTQEACFNRVIDVLMLRARLQGDEAEKDRLITHGLAIQQQWIPLSVRDELLTAWARALDLANKRYVRQYNLLVDHKIHDLSRDRWTQMWDHHQLLERLTRRVREWGAVKNTTMRPILIQAKQDVPDTGQFGPLEESAYAELELIFDRLETAIRRYHKTLLQGMAMQQEWMKEWGFEEPKAGMDLNDAPRIENCP